MGFMDSVKGIAGKIGESVEKGAKTVSDGSKKLAEKTKVKREIAALEKEVNEAYIEIGKKYYEEICAAPSEEFKQYVDVIKNNADALENARNQLMELEDKMNCTNCGAEVSKEQKFCDKCGASIVQVEPAAESTVSEE